jgi:hypothetical protein
VLASVVVGVFQVQNIMAQVPPPPAALRPLVYDVFSENITSDVLNLESVFSVKGKSVAVVMNTISNMFLHCSS